MSTMQFSNTILIVAAEAKSAVAPDLPLDDRFRAAMRKVQNHWLAPSEDDQFKAACVAVWELAADDERLRIEAELHHLTTLAALLSGVPVDFEAIEPLDDPIGLRGLWQEVSAPRSE